MDNVRVGIIGAGAVGGAIAALLDRAGHDVEVAARGEQLAAIQRRGLRLTGGFGEHLARVPAGATLTTRPDLAFVTTKAQDAEGALEAHRELLDGVTVIVAQNGLGGLAVAERILPRSPLIGALARFAASYLEPGIVTVTNAQPTVLGAGPGCSPDRLAEVVAALSPAIDILATTDLARAQWTKLLINHVNALPAITDLSVQQVVAHPGLRRIMSASLRETVRIARRVGARFDPFLRLPGPLVGCLAHAPLWLVDRVPRTIAHGMGDVPNPASTLQSIRRGRRTEIDFLNGAVVRIAREHGLAAPINAALVELVHEVEDEGRFKAPEEVLARVPQR